MPDRRSSPGAIPRRDFLDGVALAIGATALPADGLRGGAARWLLGASHDAPPVGAHYPPALTGMRGSYDAAFAVGHAIRDGKQADFLSRATATGEQYDLVVVGGGISGLAAAHFYRQAAGPSARVLVLDNHDDFGGHAKRNEFTVGGRTLIGYGGTQSIEAPALYSAEAKQLFADIGLDTQRFMTAFDSQFYRRRKLGRALFFDRETFGADRLVTGLGQRRWAEALADAPLPPAARADLARLYEGTTDYLAGKTLDEKRALLLRISYLAYLRDVVQVAPEVLAVMQPVTQGEYGVGIDAVPALDCWALEMPGFTGLGLPAEGVPGLGLTPAMHLKETEDYIYHFPDGNAGVARLLVRSLIPAALPGSTMDDSVLARLDYARLDTAASPVRIRLESTVVEVKHLGAAGASDVQVAYVRGSATETVRARHVVLACWNGIVPHLCPELPAEQQEALRYGAKVPLVYTNVAIRNWKAFDALGVSSINAPGSYFPFVTMDFPVSLGGYEFTRAPDEPTVLHLLRTPCSPGKPSREQHRAGRAELLATPFATFEERIHDQLGRMLGPGGFDAARDIAGITVNRWSHGYAYEYNSLWDPPWPPGQSPCEVGRQPHGRITIANSDAQAFAYTSSAIDQAHRAVRELGELRG